MFVFLLQIILHYRLLRYWVLWSVLYSKSLLLISIMCSGLISVNSLLLICSSPLSLPSSVIFSFVILFCIWISSHYFLDSTYKWYHIVLIFVFLLRFKKA